MRASAARIADRQQGLGAALPASDSEWRRVGMPDGPPARRLTILLVVPTLEAGAADSNVIDIVRVLGAAGHRAIVASRGGRKASEIAPAGGEWRRLDVNSVNPLIMLANVPRLLGLMRREGCDVVHAHGRSAAWSASLAARIAKRPFVTTCYKGFREQNPFKRLYNSVMARAERVIALSDGIAELVHERYGAPWDRIEVIPAGIDTGRFDPASVSRQRIEAVRRFWGVSERTRVILVAGRMLRRKGHHLVLDAIRVLRESGLKDVICVFSSADAGTSYAAELWDRVVETGISDAVRLAGPTQDLPATYAAATVVVSAAVQPEGLQRAILEAQAMARPVIVSDLGAGAEVVLAPPSVSEERMTGLRFPSGDAAALKGAIVRLLSMPEPVRDAIGQRGRAWVMDAFNPQLVARQTLALYAGLASAGAFPRT